MANNIKQLREAAGMTQAELAAKMRLTTPSITKWERGRANPTYDNLIQLAFLFVRLAGHGVFVCTDCRADYLLV